MRLISIINQKGGSGKTTTTVSLASSLSFYYKKRVLIVDIDPQGSASLWFNKPCIEKGLFKVFLENENIENVILTTEFENLYIIPSSTWLVGLEKALANEVGAETILKRSLYNIVDQDKFDYILFDCPPNLGIITINALSACNEVVIPVESRIMALSGLIQLLNTIDIVKSRINKNLKIAGILACKADLRTNHSKEVIEKLRLKFSTLVYKTIIRENVKLAQAPSFNKPIVYYDHLSNGSLDYLEFTKEFIEQESLISKYRSLNNNYLNI
jgi:chromosome partitioning protein